MLVLSPYCDRYDEITKVSAAVRVPIRQRPSLRTWLRRYRRHHARTFHELDPATGHWRRL